MKFRAAWSGTFVFLNCSRSSTVMANTWSLSRRNIRLWSSPISTSPVSGRLS